MNIEDSRYWYSALAKSIRAHRIDKFETQLRTALDKGFDIDFMNQRKVTLLNVLGINYIGDNEADQKCLKLLLEAGADVNKKNPDGRSPVTWFTSERFMPIDLFTTIINKAEESDLVLFDRLAINFGNERPNKPDNRLAQIQAFLESGRDAREWLEQIDNPNEHRAQFVRLCLNPDQLKELKRIIANYYETRNQLEVADCMYDYEL